MPAPAPTFHSLAFRNQPPPDWADVVLTALPSRSTGSAQYWAEQVFSFEHGPKPVLVLLMLRQQLVRLLGINQSSPDVFAVREVQGDEALIVAEEPHLTFRCAVGVDHGSGLLRVTTAVWLHSRRGKLYFAPVSVLHDPVTRSMMVKAVQRDAGTLRQRSSKRRRVALPTQAGEVDRRASTQTATAPRYR